MSSEQGVALHIRLPQDKMVQLEILNIHHPDPNSPEIEFDVNDFQAEECLVDGVKHNFAQYITDNKIDIKAPLTCDYSGATFNVCIKEVHEVDGKVDFYAPVFKGRKYRTDFFLKSSTLPHLK